MATWNTATMLVTGTAIQSVPVTFASTNTVTFEWVPFYPRIWRTGSLGQDIGNITQQFREFRPCPEDVPEVVEITMGCETGTAGNYISEARVFREITADELREWRTEAERRTLAAETAEQLLLSCLNDEQRCTWAQSEYFIVETNGRRYKLFKSSPIIRVDEGGATLFHYCIHTYNVPRCDELLTHKLLLEANEPYFLRTANATITEHGRRSLPSGFAGRLATPVHPEVQTQIAA